MLQIPEALFVQGVMPTGKLDKEEINVSPNQFGAQVGQAEEKLGATAEQTGNMLAQHVIAFQNINNETAATKADVELAKRLADLQYNVDPSKPLGFNNLRGADAVAAQQDFEHQVDQAYQDVRNTLNGAAQRMFDGVATRRTAYTLQSAEEHASREWLSDMLDTSKERIAVQRNLAATDAYNPLILNQTLGLIQSETQKMADRLGKHDSIWMQDQMQTEKDQLYHDVALRQATDTTNPNGGPVAALDFYNRHKGEMSLRMQTELEAKLRPLAQVWDSHKFVNGLVNGVSGTRSSGGLEDALVNQESGGRDFNEDGTPVTSVRGAKYAWQVMPSTAADPGFGIKPAQSDTPGEYNRVGKELLAALQNKYGDNMLAVAAYNAGFKTVDKLITKYGDPRTGAISQDDFISHLPVSRDENGRVINDTPAYVRNILANTGQSPLVADASGQTVPAQTGSMIAPAAPQFGQRTVDELESSLPGWEKEIVAKYPDNPVAQAQALGILHSTVNAQIATLKKTAQADTNFLWRAYADPKGPRDLQTFLSTPANNDVYARVLQSNPLTVVSFNEAMAKKAGADVTPTNEQTIGRYYGLLGEARSDSDTFANRNLMAEYQNVPFQELNKLFSLQDAIRRHDASEEGKATSLKNALNLVQSNLITAGIYDPAKTPQKQGSAYAQFQGRFAEVLDQFQAENNKRPKDAEIKQIATDLLQKVTVPGSFFGNSQKPLFALKPDQEMRAKMPQTEVPQYTEDFKQVYGRDPFSGELDQLYFATKLHPGDKDMLRKIDAQIRQNSLRLIPASSKSNALQQTSEQSSTYDRGRALQEYLAPQFQNSGLPYNQ
jgi:soluble lytic murein transglycosylase